MSAIPFEALFNASPNPYVVFDPLLTIVGANEAYLRATHSRRDDIVGRHLFDAFPSDPASEGGRRLRLSLQRVIDEKVPDHLALIPYRVEHEDGEAPERFWSATHTPLFDEAGNLQFILQHTVDVTDLEQQRIDKHGVFQRARALQSDNETLSTERLHLRRLFKQAPSFMAVLHGPEHVFELANDAYRRLVGDRDVIGLRVLEALPELIDQGFVQILDGVRASGQPFVGRGVSIMLHGRHGNEPGERFLDFVYQPIFDAAGAVERIFVQGHDITEQRRAEQDLKRQSDFLRLAHDAGGIGTFDFDLATQRVRGSKTFGELYGFEPAGDEGWPVQRIIDAVPEEDRERLTTSSRVLEDTVKRVEYRVQTPSGIRWIVRQGEIVRDGSGTPVRVIGAAYDITERKEAEAQREMLMQESAHRVKNMLALVNAVTSQTLRNATSLADASTNVGARLAALSHAHDVLMARNWGSAEIIDVVGAATRLLADKEGRVSFDGELATLEPKAALGLALMLHELGTNALKYGSLSAPEGRVAIDWVVETTPEGRFARFRWQEMGGPVVAPPTHKGFGSKLIERGLAANMGGPVTIDYAPSGLVCVAMIRLAA